MARRKTHEEFVAEVRALVGDEYTVLGTYVNTHFKIDLRHNVCGNPMSVAPGHFLKGTRCKDCREFGRRKTTEEFKKEMFELYGKEYLVVGEYKTCMTDVDVKHEKCGHIWPVRPNNILNGKRCPRCASSKGERRIHHFLTMMGLAFRHQFRINDCKDKYPLPFDFAITKSNGSIACLLEYDGRQHFDAVDAFGGVDKLFETQWRDAIKTQYCADNGIPLIRIPYWDFDNIDAILTEKLLPLLKVDASLTQKNAS